MSSNPLFSGPAADPSPPSRLWQVFWGQIVLMLLVVALGAWMLHQQSRGSTPDAQAQAAVEARELLDAVGQVGLASRQAAADSPEALRRSAEARERVLSLERSLRRGLGQPAAVWLPSLLDSVAAAREDACQWLDLAQRQGRDGQAAEAARTLQTRAQLAESRWRAQAEELQRRIDLHLRSERLQRQEASQRLLMQWLAWSLTAVALSGWLGLSLLRRARSAWEKQLRAVPPSPGGARTEPMAVPAAASLTFVRPVAPVAPVTPVSTAAGAAASGVGPSVAAGPSVDGGRPAVAPAETGLSNHPLRRANDRLQRNRPAPGAAGTAAGSAPGSTFSADKGVLPGAAASRPASLTPGQAESARQVIARAKAAAHRTASAAPVPSSRPMPPSTCGDDSPAAASTALALPLDPGVLHNAADLAERGSSLVSQVVANIEDIGATGRRIAEIVALIDSIAFQTNLLALNAAVEAARSRQGSAAAGAAADVRSLAQRATQAAREIRALVQAGGDGSAGAVAQALQQDTGTTMEALLSSVQQAAEIVTQVRKAAEGQAEAVAAPVQESVEQLDRMQRNHAALAEQSAGTAESLRQQAERLQKVLGAFKLLQQTQQAAWGAHTAIRDARQKAGASANDSGFGSLGGPAWRPDPGNHSGDANGTEGGWRPF